MTVNDDNTMTTGLYRYIMLPIQKKGIYRYIMLPI